MYRPLPSLWVNVKPSFLNLDRERSKLVDLPPVRALHQISTATRGAVLSEERDVRLEVVSRKCVERRESNRILRLTIPSKTFSLVRMKRGLDLDHLV